jgi:3-hydroxyacyl-CoA dehydrogenase/3a,7a,12a-trihydroxy-5b-cholest-24-enoyl-CoA hydratase
MADELRFDGKVVIVTGAGGGLGRSHALAFASRGARVVVNDLGGSMHGDGKSTRAADAVVEEIKGAGGTAVANYDSVEDGDKIVKTALDAFGRVDVVINNAGILRDVSFQKMTPADWEIIQRVHVNGSFRVTHAAWPHMREQGYGRIVMTASAAGIYGNFGQANYSAAKLGLVGLSNTLAIEGGKRGIHVNTIAPIAGSRLTETVLPKELVDALKPEYVSPLVLWLCHESCQENGGLFEVGGGYFGKLRWQRTQGHAVRVGRAITPELVKSQWKEISGFDKTTTPASVTESMEAVLDNLRRGPSKGGNDLVDADEALGFEYPEMRSSYDERDLALYALGVGAADDPLDDKDLRLVYEMHGGGFAAAPTFAVIPAMRALIDRAKEGFQVPGLRYGLDRLLHGEQYTEVIRPFPKSAKLTHRARIKEIWDKGKGAIINTEARTFDESGELLAVNEYVYFIRGAGGFGGDRGPSSEINNPPDRKPDAVIEQRIHENQALLYRLSGDVNPLHVDPGFAKAFGFERPILHGLCSFGYAGRHVVRAFADGDPRLFKSIKVRFVKSVFPGETLVTEMWKEAPRRIVFRCKVKERDEVVISNAAIELYEHVPQPKPKAAPVATAAPTASATEPTSADIFKAIGKHIAAHPELPQQVGKVFQFSLAAPASSWTVDVKNGAGQVTAGEGQADCVLELSDADFLAMCTGKADPQKLYFGGQLKIKGDIMASQKLSFLKKLDPALVIEAMRERAGGAGAPAAAAPASAAPVSHDVFLGIKAYVGAHPELAERVQKVFQFQLKNPDSTWTIDLKTAPGAVAEGESTTPDTVLEIAESDFIDLTSGKADAQKLYFGGQLKIKGDIMASQRLNFLQKIDPAWAREQVAKMKADGGASAPAAAPAAPAKKAAHAAEVIAALKKRLGESPALAREVGGVVELRVKEPDAVWTLAFAGATPEVRESGAQDPAAVLTMSDADLWRLAKGEASLEELFRRGGLRLDGDVRVAQRLQLLSKLC